MNILVLGSTGFIGTQTVQALQQAGHTVRCAKRDSINFLKLDTDRAQAEFTDIDTVINAVGIMSHRSSELEQVHHHAPLQLATLAHAAGVSRWVQLSALGADPSHYAAFLSSKGRGDSAIAALPFARGVGIARPSIVYGRGGASTELFIRFARLPLLLLPNAGNAAVQPVHVEDVAAGLSALAINTDTAPIAFVGLRSTTLANYLTTLRRNLYGKAPAKIYGLPTWLVKLSTTLGNRLTHGFLSADNMRILADGSTANNADFAALLQRPPRVFTEFR